MRNRETFSGLIWVLFGIVMSGALIWFVARANHRSAGKENVNQAQPVPYRILADEMGTIIRIGVESNVNDEQLRATLVNAANEHQDDPGRDYLTSMFLWVEAYLENDGRESNIPAGRLRRSVPLANPAARKNTSIDRTDGDNLTITLDEAKRSLQ